MNRLKVGNVVKYHGTTWTVTGIGPKNVKLTPIYSDEGTITVERSPKIDKIANSPAQWAMMAIEGAI